MQELAKSLLWIHEELSQANFALLLQDTLRRLANQPVALHPALVPMVATDAGKLTAASYFKLLAGDVATLGGVRAAEGWDAHAAELIISQVDCLRSERVPQIQAVVPAFDRATSTLVERAGLTQLTHVEHQWLDLSASVGVQARAETTPALSSLRWRAADDFARSRLARLIEATFQDTLDCPVLNGIRDQDKVLNGFLDGRSLRTVGCMWEVLEFRGEVAGCLLLQPHGNGVMELAYLGLLPEARGMRLGKQLVQRAIELAGQYRAQALIAAVDEQNWPAQQLYRHFGFEPQQRFEVWLAPS